MSDVFDLFVQSVKQKKQITCKYNGHYRELCVHAVGWKQNEEQAIAFQFGGESSTGLPPGGEWRCLKLSIVQDAKMRDGDWHTSDNHSKQQTCVDEIAIEVDY